MLVDVNAAPVARRLALLPSRRARTVLTDATHYAVAVSGTIVPTRAVAMLVLRR